MTTHISKSDQNIVNGLSQLLADTYTLYLKTQNFHWNVTGPAFFTLHGLFEQQYTGYIAPIDEIAERIRSLGAVAPGSFSQFAQIASIKDANGVPTAEKMIEELTRDNDHIAESLRPVLALAEAAHDGPTVDLLNQRIAAHQKNTWMMRSLRASASN